MTRKLIDKLLAKLFPFPSKEQRGINQRMKEALHADNK
jgi:hypothetical protein